MMRLLRFLRRKNPGRVLSSSRGGCRRPKLARARTLCLVCLLVASGLAYAGPKSGGSFGGLSGFRSSSGSASRGLARSSGSYGGGSSFVFLPSFGYGGWGFGGGMGRMFGGRPASDVRSDGARSNTVLAMADGTYSPIQPSYDRDVEACISRISLAYPPALREELRVPERFVILRLLEMDTSFEEQVGTRHGELVRFVDALPGFVWSALPDGHVDFVKYNDNSGDFPMNDTGLQLNAPGQDR